MDPNDLVTIAEIQNETLEDLPYDVLRELFDYIPTRNLISVWRLVSTKWSHFATELCRQRSVSLRLPRLHEIFNVPIGHLFSDVDNLPFSKLQLALDSKMDECHVFSGYVARRFGRHVTSAHVSARLEDYRAFFETLERTPNLVSLEISPKAESHWYEEAEEDFAEFEFEEIDLPALKSLKMVYEPRGHFMRILEAFLQQLSQQLDTVDLQLTSTSAFRHQISDYEFAHCAQLLSSRNFRKLTLGLPLETVYTNGWNTLAGRGRFDIRNLTVTSNQVETEALDMTSDLLGPFLANCSGLTSLTLEGFQKRSLTSRLCRVPLMPAVKKLSLTAEFTLSENGGPISRLQFEPFTVQQFPNLKDVTLHCNGYYDGSRGEFDVRQFFDVSGGRFLGVTSLDIGCTPSTTNWADAFPNVQKLSAVMCWRTEQRLSPIFQNMTQLTDLDLEIGGRFFDLLKFLHASEKLKNLTLHILEMGDEVGAFAALSPLNLKLIYPSHKVSDCCIALLRSRHLSVELNEGD